MIFPCKYQQTMVSHGFKEVQNVVHPQHQSHPRSVVGLREPPLSLTLISPRNNQNHDASERKLSPAMQSGVWSLSCSVTLEKKEPFLGKTIFSGAATQKKGKKGATEQLRSLKMNVETSRKHSETLLRQKKVNIVHRFTAKSG